MLRMFILYVDIVQLHGNWFSCTYLSFPLVETESYIIYSYWHHDHTGNRMRRGNLILSSAILPVNPRVLLSFIPCIYLKILSSFIP